MLHQPVEVFRSARRRACDERAFVLTAVGIFNDLVWDDAGYVVRVEGVALAHARHHLAQYEQERLRRRLPEPAAFMQPRAWLGAACYALLLLLVPLIAARGWLPVNPYAIAVMDPERMATGQWWRAWTALTLHWDAPHLLGNLGAGVLLGYCAAQIWGNARAWALIACAAASANLLESLVGPSNYVSAGASTAVFAALGLIAAHTWRTRRVHVEGSMRRWVPLIAGVAVLALFGAGDAAPQGGNQTNVLSHALGFVFGTALGVVVASRRGASMLAAVPAWFAALLALGPILAAWALAVRTAV